MKSTFALLALLCAAVAARAQNTFPSSGAVGIGTTTPASPLEIKTGVNWDATSSNYAGALDLGYNNDYGAGNPAQYLLLFPQFAGSIVSAAGMSGVIRDYRGMGVTFNSPSEYTIVGQTAYGNSYINVIPRSVVSGVLTVYSVTYGGVVYLALRGQDLCGSSAHLTFSGYFWNEINGVKPQLVASSSCTNVSIFTETTELIPNALSANTENYIGVGTNNPEEPLHVVGHADALNVGGQYNGDAVIQANTGGRTATSGGASLEFAIPANSDGSNVWGQARLIAIPGNTASGDATGKLVAGTRRYFNKYNTGTSWYYGDDLTIDGSGNVGIGTLNPQSLLAVAGTVTAKQVTVTTTGWSDFVFAPGYVLPSLDSVAVYVRLHSHLPGVPSAADVARDGQDLGEMNKLLLQKVEELTLYQVDANRRMAAAEADANRRIAALEAENEELKKTLQTIKDKLRL